MRRRLLPAAGLLLGLLALGGVLWLQTPAPEDEPSAARVPTTGRPDPSLAQHLPGARGEVRAAGEETGRVEPAGVEVPTLRGHPESRPPGGTWDAVAEDGAGEGKRTVTGLVYAASTRRPLGGVAVTFRGVGGTAEVLTDERGVYEIRLPRTVYWYERLRFTKDGYLQNSMEHVHRRNRPGGRVEPTGLRAARGTLPGIVRDHRGKPVPGVFVRVAHHESPFVSDARGRFGPVATGGGQIHWVAWGPACARTEDFWDPEEQSPSLLVVTVVPHAFVEGLVVDEASQPVAGATVLCRRYPDELSVRTMVDGAFRWPLPMGQGATLVAFADGRDGLTYARVDVPATIVLHRHASGTWRERYGPHWAPRPPPVEEVGARPKARVRLLAVDAAGLPLEWADVQIHRRGGGYLQRAWTRSDGTCALVAPSGLELELEVTHFDAGRARRRVTFEAGPPREFRVALERPPPRTTSPTAEPNEPPATWTGGTVLDAKGRPYPGVWIHAYPWDSDASDELGRFLLQGGAPGDRLHLHVEGSDFPAFTAPALCGHPDNVVRLPARGAVRVKLAGTPAEGSEAKVRLWAAPGVEEDLLPYRDPTYVRRDARGYRIDCPVGRVTVAFRMEPGQWALYPDVRVDEARETEVVYAFPQFGRLTGRVRTATGKPIEDACISIAATNEDIAYTNAEGRFELDLRENPAGPAGTVRLRVDGPGFAPCWTEPVDLAAAESIDVRLRPGVLVSGVLRDAEGRGVKATVAWQVDRGPPLYAGDTKKDGTFELEGWLAPGPARLVVHVDGRPPHAELVSVTPGPNGTRVTLRLP